MAAGHSRAAGWLACRNRSARKRPESSLPPRKRQMWEARTRAQRKAKTLCVVSKKTDWGPDENSPRATTKLKVIATSRRLSAEATSVNCVEGREM